MSKIINFIKEELIKKRKKKIILGLTVFFMGIIFIFSDIGILNSNEEITLSEKIMLMITNVFETFLFFEIFSIPLIVIWLGFAALFFSFRIGFPNLRLFTHGIKVAFGKYYSDKDPGQIKPVQAAMIAISGTVGLGNIAGVAIAIGIGGPGSVLWMVMMGFLGMSVVFSEAVVSQKYRFIDKDGTVYGGPFRYLRYGLAEVGLVRFGQFLAFIFTLFFTIGAIGTPIFQTHQVISSLVTTFKSLENAGETIAIALTVFTAAVMIGGVTRVSKVTQVLVPLMAITYVGSCLFIIAVNIENLTTALAIIFKDALGIESVTGGFVGTVVLGIRRAAFSNEAGLGTSPIVHAAAKSAEPVRQASVACLNPFMDTVVVCFLTGIVITITGAYKEVGDGVVMTTNAFSSVSNFLPIMLSISIALFGISTVLAYGYYGKNAWIMIFGKRTKNIYVVLFCTCVLIAGKINFSTIVRLSENLTLSVAVPNLIGLYILSNIIRREYKKYVTRLRNGEFEEIK